MFFRKRQHIAELSDEALVDQYKSSGDQACVGVLYDRYAHMVFLVCMKYLKHPTEAEDVSMQVFEKLIGDLHRYELRSFKYWLHTVTKNQCLIHLDRQKRQRTKSDVYQATLQAYTDTSIDQFVPTEALLREDKINRLETALEALKGEQRVCVELFYLNHKSYQEISEATGYSLKQVKSYIQNGKRNLKIRIETLEQLESTNE